MLKSVSRFVVNKLMTQRLKGPFVHDADYCWVASLPEFKDRSDTEGNERRSSLVLYENGVPLGEAHDAHDAIRFIGNGAYSHWGTVLLFSTTDNSDPNTNGRRYTFSFSPWLYKRRVCRKQFSGTTPVNYQLLYSDDDKIRADAVQAYNTGQYYRASLREQIPSFKGKTVLEVGPGHNFGSAMVLAAYGAWPVVTDRFLAPWQGTYHRKFYSILMELLATDSDADVGPVKALVEANGYRENVIARIEAPMEQLPLANDSVDCVLSSAVIEHVYDQGLAFKESHRITRRGGYGLHFVDHRDHRNFQRPLEYLLLSDPSFKLVFQRCHCECGNQIRPDETAELARAAGFEVVRIREDSHAQNQYLEEFIFRLRAATYSRFNKYTADELRVITASFWLRKP